jgi:hypothetical protein
MDSELTTWLHMVFAALSDQDDTRRGIRLREAQSFLEESRRQKKSLR